MAIRRCRELADYRRFEMEDEVHDRLQFASKSDDVELVESDDDFSCLVYLPPAIPFSFSSFQYNVCSCNLQFN